jgi:putative FmdB family regulatory protein
MPLYDFTCVNCGTKFESLVRREADVASVGCPECHGPRVRRELSLPAPPVSGPEPVAADCGVGPPCGAPWCQRKG